MSTLPTPIFPQALNLGIGVITAANTQTYETAFTAGANGSKIESLVITSTDTSARDITINVTRSATNYQLTVLSIPATAGIADNVPSVNVLGNSQIPGLAKDANGNPYLYLKSGDTLTINAPVTLTAAKQVVAFASGGDFCCLVRSRRN